MRKVIINIFLMILEVLFFGFILAALIFIISFIINSTIPFVALWFISSMWHIFISGLEYMYKTNKELFEKLDAEKAESKDYNVSR
jgi:hypothetical protein